MIPVLVTAVVAVLPCEFEVDCSGVPPGGKFEFAYRYECRDGTVLKDEGDGDGGVTASLMVLALAGDAEDRGWSVERIGRPNSHAFVIRGSATSPIKSVTFGGDWKPLVTRRLATRPPPGPKK